NGGVLRDLDGKFGSASGEASVGGAIKPAHDDALFEGFELFMPYAQLHLRSGTHALRYVVRIFEDDDPWRELSADHTRRASMSSAGDHASVPAKGAAYIADFLIQQKVPYVFGLCGHGIL